MAYALLTAESPYADDADTWARSHGAFVRDVRVDEGCDPTPEPFIRRCMIVTPHRRMPPHALVDMLW